MSVVITTQTIGTVASQPDAVKRHKNVLRGLGITETVIALIFLVVQIWGGISANQQISSSVMGYLGAIIMVVAGSLGIASGKETASPPLINTHMGFSIIGSILSLANFLGGIILLTPLFVVLNSLTLVSPQLQGLLALLFLVIILTLLEGILFIVSAAYCCKTTRSLGFACCCGGCGQQPVVVATMPANHQVAYTNQNMSMS